MTLEQLAEHIGAELRLANGADPRRVVVRCARLEDAGEEDITFLVNPRYTSQLEHTSAAAVIVAPEVDCPERTLLAAPDPYYAFRNAMVALHGWREHPTAQGPSISPQAIVDSSARIGEGTVVHPLAVISRDAVIGERCVIYPHVFIGPGARIGSDGQLFPSVTIYDGCVLGDRVTLHAGCVIGQDGFGYATHAGEHHKIPQTGNVVIEDDVEMGANCAVDRATLGSTIIGAGTKFSNSVTIGHGCHIGRANLFVGQVGLAGSVTTGDYVAMGGQVGVAGHLTIGDRVQIAATSGVMNDIPDDTVVGGTPAQPLTEAKRVHLHTQRLPDLAGRIKRLERELGQLRRLADDTDAAKTTGSSSP
jgi:UDP-3-O-[3-hydroxymyristoyl] glucosamine N-acyltransferase